MFSGLTKEEAAIQEKRLIEKWELTNPDKGYNYYPGGKIVEPSAAAKRKLSFRNKGRGNPFYGKHHNEKTKALISQLKPKTRVKCVETGEIYESTRAA